MTSRFSDTSCQAVLTGTSVHGRCTATIRLELAS
jgi:hypothetical protein